MAEISANLVKQLRERTGAGMMECKKALTEANGDLAEAEVVLRKRGLASAGKKAGRATRQGLISAQVSEGGKLGVLLEVNCESDFVARTDDFQALVNDLSAQIAHTKPADAAALMSQPFSKDQGTTVEQYIAGRIAKIGENITVPRFATYEAEGKLGTYLHAGNQLGVLVEATGEVSDELLRDIAMQIAAADPKFIRREDVTAEAIDKEKDIQRSRALNEGKPEKMIEKIIEGRMGKFYEEICLLEQPFVKEPSQTVGSLLKGKGDVKRFSRFKVGETAPAEQAEDAQA